MLCKSKDLNPGTVLVLSLYGALTRARIVEPGLRLLVPTGCKPMGAQGLGTRPLLCMCTVKASCVRQQQLLAMCLATVPPTHRSFLPPVYTAPRPCLIA